MIRFSDQFTFGYDGDQWRLFGGQAPYWYTMLESVPRAIQREDDAVDVSAFASLLEARERAVEGVMERLLVPTFAITNEALAETLRSLSADMGQTPSDKRQPRSRK